MSTFKNKNSVRTIEAQIAQKLKNNEARPKFTGSYKKKKAGILQTVRCSSNEALLGGWFIPYPYNSKFNYPLSLILALHLSLKFPDLCILDICTFSRSDISC